MSSLSVSYQRIYNSITVTKSPNHTLSLHRPTSNSSSTLTELLCAVEFPFSCLNSDLILATGCRYIDSARTQRKTQPVLLRSLFTARLPSNRRPLVECYCIAGICLQALCLATVRYVIIFIVDELRSFIKLASTTVYRP
jgi:hypothetical protein